MGGQAFTGPRGQYFLLEPEKLMLITDKAHPLFDSRVGLPIDEGMVRSIMAFGVKEPILVCKDGPNTVVVDGLQRVKNAIVANERLRSENKEPVLIKAIIERGSEEDLYGVKILANECRQEDLPLIKAEKLQKYLAMGRSEAQAAIVFGTTLATIKQLVLLQDLAGPVRTAIGRGVLTLSAATHFAKLPREKQAKELERLEAKSAVKGKKKGRVTVRAVKAASGVQPPTRKEIQAVIGTALLGEDAEAALRWALGELALGSVRTALYSLMPSAKLEQAAPEAQAPSEATTPAYPGA